jgi:uncharacterized protein (TIGR03084 family)
LRDVLSDLTDEHADLDSIVAALSEPGWDTPTPSEPWTVRDQISHLAFFDEMASLSARHPQRFSDQLNLTMGDGPAALEMSYLNKGRSLTADELLSWWREARSDLIEAFTSLEPDKRVPWFGPPMKARSAAIARMMETWAHGQDVADALGLQRPPTGRLFHIAELGVKTYGWSFANRGLEVPEERVRVALRGPSGTTKVWNDESASSITGAVEDFCLVVSQRRNYRHTTLVIEGQPARQWMEIAQVFAGPPGPGRPASAP